MNGYVQHKSPTWTHVMKRNVGPNEKIFLDELYDQYGKKHDLAEGEEFVNWLKNVKLQDEDQWEIFFAEDVEKLEEQPEEVEKFEEKEEINTVDNKVVISAGRGEKIDIHNMTVNDIVELSVRKAREVVPMIQDLNLLKYALQEAQPRAGKDSLCQILRKRIQTMHRLS